MCGWAARSVPFAFHAAPHRRLLLGDAQEHDPALATRRRGGVDERPGDRLLVLALGEVDDRDVLGLGPAMELGDVGSPIRPKAAELGIR